MLTQDEIDDWYFDTPIYRPVFPVKPCGEPVDYEKTARDTLKRYPKIMNALHESELDDWEIIDGPAW